MDVAIISAMAAIAGSSVGALATFTTTWLVQNNHEQTQRRGLEIPRSCTVSAEQIIHRATRMAAERGPRRYESGTLQGGSSPSVNRSVGASE